MQPQPASHGERSSVRLPRILVVDDEAGFTRLMKMNLEATGRYIVHAENDPQKAFHAATEFHPDLVLLDIMMPGLDGGDVASRFKNDPHLKRVPVIFLTATVRRAEVDARHGDFGGEHFLSKPIALPELLKCLDEHFASTDQKTFSMRA